MTVKGASTRATRGPALNPLQPLSRSPQNNAVFGVRSGLKEEEQTLVCVPAAQAPAAPLRPRGHADADALRGERRPPGWLRACPRRRLPPARTPSAPGSVSGTQPADPGTGAVLLATAAPWQLRRPHMQARTRPVGDRPLSGGLWPDPWSQQHSASPTRRDGRPSPMAKAVPGRPTCPACCGSSVNSRAPGKSPEDARCTRGRRAPSAALDGDAGRWQSAGTASSLRALRPGKTAETGINQHRGTSDYRCANKGDAAASWKYKVRTKGAWQGARSGGGRSPRVQRGTASRVRICEWKDVACSSFFCFSVCLSFS